MSPVLTLLRGRLLQAAAFAGILALSSSLAHAGIGDIDANGWTQLTPSADSRLVYVSSSTGSDTNDGLSPATPKQTIGAADALIRTGYPDWILLKRGDTFPQPSLGRWKSGRSAAEPLVMTYYGDSGERPIIKLTGRLVFWEGQGRSHLAFVGLDLYRSISDPDSPDFTNASCSQALALNPGNVNSANVLIEDCRFRFCWINLEGSNQSTDYMLYNVNVRRNIVAGNWSHGSSTGSNGRIQGMYVSNTSDALIEENLFHHNGWSEVIADAEAAQYSHNIYMSERNTGTILVRGNVFSYGAAHGLQLRSGGTAEMNAFVGNAIGMNMGYSIYPTRYTGNTYVRDNVVTDGRPQVPNDISAPQTGAIWGLWKQLINNTSVDNNIVANILDNRGGNMRPYNDMAANELGSGNIAWNWVQGNNPTIDPGWAAPSRNAASFAAALGLADYNAWIAAGMNRPLRTMPFAQTAYCYVNYIRAGFNKAAVMPPYTYEGGSGGSGASSESFDHLAASTTDPLSSGSYVGDNGATWNFANTLRLAAGITGTTAQLRQANGYIESTIPGGVDDLSFTIRTIPGASPATAVIGVLVDGLSRGTFSPTQTNVPFHLVLPALNETGPTTVRFASLGSQPAWLDDIAWSDNTTPPPPSSIPTGGSESFTNLNASTTDQFSSGLYTGDNGEAWTYGATLKIDSGISGVTAQLRRLNGWIQTTLPAGVADLSFTLQTEPLKNPSTAVVEVLVDSVSQGTFQPTQTDVPFQVDLTGLGKTGATVVRINSVGNNQAWIDNLIWTNPAAVPASALTSITPGGFVLNRRTAQVTQTVTVKNTSAQAVPGPVYLKLGSLSSNTTLTNAAGNSGGSPYLIVSTGDLPIGASVAVVLQFSAPASGGITYTPSIVLAP